MKTNIYILTKLMLMEKNIFTYNDIAAKASISNKTIRNNIQAINALLTANELKLQKSPGIGIKIIGDKSSKLKCYKECENKIKNNKQMPSEIRQKIITYLLLEGKRKITISYLEKQLFITRPSIYNDLKFIKTYLKHYDIGINKNRKTGLVADAGEKRIRHCLLDLCFKLKNDNINNYCLSKEIISFINLTSDTQSRHYLDIKSFIIQMSKASNTAITSSDLERATIFMIIAFNRIKNNKSVSVSPKIIDKIKNKELAEIIIKNIDGLAKKFGMKINTEETIYITAQLSAYMISNYENILKESSDPKLLIKVIKSFYNELSTKVQTIDYTYFKNNLFTFLEKTMQKFNFDYDCYNPNTPIIKNQYPKLYQLSSLINKSMNNYIGAILPDDAIATITLLLAFLAENYAKNINCLYISQEHPFKKNLTLSILKNNLSNINIETINTEENINRDYDLILCSHDHFKTQENIISIPSIIDNEFLLLLNEKIKEIREYKKTTYIK